MPATVLIKNPFSSTIASDFFDKVMNTGSIHNSDADWILGERGYDLKSSLPCEIKRSKLKTVEIRHRKIDDLPASPSCSFAQSMLVFRFSRYPLLKKQLEKKVFLPSERVKVIIL
jgi:hypothetical protein